jgi:hypothetical protein
VKKITHLIFFLSGTYGENAWVKSVYDTPIRNAMLAGTLSGSTGPAPLRILTIYNWLMHLLFLIAGVGVVNALEKRSPVRFISEWRNRLLLRALLGTLLIIPGQAWLREPVFQKTFVRRPVSSDVRKMLNSDANSHLKPNCEPYTTVMICFAKTFVLVRQQREGTFSLERRQSDVIPKPGLTI